MQKLEEEVRDLREALDRQKHQAAHLTEKHEMSEKEKAALDKQWQAKLDSAKQDWEAKLKVSAAPLGPTSSLNAVRGLDNMQAIVAVEHTWFGQAIITATCIVFNIISTCTAPRHRTMIHWPVAYRAV